MLVRFSWNGVLTTLLIVASLSAGCDSSPTRPSATAAVEPPPPLSMLSVDAVTPTAGSTAGSTWGVITGTGFERAATVRFGAEKLSQVVVESSTLIRFWTTAHAAGAVDVVVTNPGNQSATLPRAYSYATPGSFDFNGDWIAHAGSDFEEDMRFTIRNNVLVSLSCGDRPVPFSPATVITSGEFSSPASEGVPLSGRLASSTTAVGTIGIAPCASTWWADKGGATP